MPVGDLLAASGADVPEPLDPIPDQPEETPPDAPLESPDAPDVPPEDLPPDDLPQELPDLPDPEAPEESPDDTPAFPETPEELPDTTPVLPDETPEDAPAPWDPLPDDMPQEIPTQPGFEAVTLRAGQPLDAGKLGDIISQAVTAATWKPRLHSSVEDIAHAGRMIDKGWITVAELDGRIAGFLAREGDYIHSLYIADHAQGRGVGSALLTAAKEGRDRLDLWTFQQNRGAQRFYRREGFVAGEETDGQHNDEGLPDIRFTWTR